MSGEIDSQHKNAIIVVLEKILERVKEEKFKSLSVNYTNNKLSESPPITFEGFTVTLKAKYVEPKTDEGMPY